MLEEYCRSKAPPPVRAPKSNTKSGRGNFTNGSAARIPAVFRQSMGDDGLKDAYLDVLKIGTWQSSASLKSCWRA